MRNDTLDKNKWASLTEFNIFCCLFVWGKCFFKYHLQMDEKKLQEKTFSNLLSTYLKYAIVSLRIVPLARVIDQTKNTHSCTHHIHTQIFIIKWDTRTAATVSDVFLSFRCVFNFVFLALCYLVFFLFIWLDGNSLQHSLH